MKRKHLIIIIMLSIIIVFNGILIFLLEKDQCECNNMIIDGYFDITDYSDKINTETSLKESYPLMIHDVKTAKLVAEEIWDDSDHSTSENYKVYFDFRSNTWLIVKNLPKGTLGNALYILIKTNGEVLARW